MSLHEDPENARGRALGLSLWLVPEGAFKDRLASVIRMLSERFGAPLFEPHVTLLSGISGDEATVRAATKRLCGELAPFGVRLEKVARREEYFRALFVEAIGGPALAAAHSAGCRELGHRPSSPFSPHLSLAYGRADARDRELAGREVSNQVQGRFEARALHLWRTEGPVSQWRELEVLSFGTL